DPTCPDHLDPTNTTVANNSVTCAMTGVQIYPTTGLTFRNLSISNNTINVCNAARGTQYILPGFTDFSGIETRHYKPTDKRPYTGDVDGLTINYNVITFEKEIRGYNDGGQASAGIRLWQYGNLSNVLVKGNIIKDAPAGGIAEPSRMWCLGILRSI